MLPSLLLPGFGCGEWQQSPWSHSGEDYVEGQPLGQLFSARPLGGFYWHSRANDRGNGGQQIYPCKLCGSLPKKAGKARRALSGGKPWYRPCWCSFICPVLPVTQGSITPCLEPPSWSVCSQSRLYPGFLIAFRGEDAHPCTLTAQIFWKPCQDAGETRWKRHRYPSEHTAQRRAQKRFQICMWRWADFFLH